MKISLIILLSILFLPLSNSYAIDFPFCNDLVYSLCQLNEGHIPELQALSEPKGTDAKYYRKIKALYVKKSSLYKSIPPIMKHYTSSKDTGIQTMIKSFLPALKDLIEITDDQIKNTDDALSGKISDTVYSTKILISLNEQEQLFKKISKVCFYCSVVLIDNKRKNSLRELEYLVFTDKERIQLIDKLDAHFGRDIATSEFFNKNYLIQSAGYIRNILKSGYKSKDQ